MKSGDMANLKQIAAELSLSVTTVSRALKDGPEVLPSTIARVKEAAKRLGYVPNHHGRALKTGRTLTLTAVLPMETRDYLSDLLKLPLIEGMTLAARQAGYSLSIYSTTPDDDPVESVQRQLQARSSDGLIITRMVSGDPRVKLLLDERMPFVAFGRTDLDTAYPYVDVDNEQIAYEATRRLMDKGCRRIALQLLVPEDQASAMRLSGYGRAMAEAGIAIDQSLIGHGMFTMESVPHGSIACWRRQIRRRAWHVPTNWAFWERYTLSASGVSSLAVMSTSSRVTARGLHASCRQRLKFILWTWRVSDANLSRFWSAG